MTDYDDGYGNAGFIESGCMHGTIKPQPPVQPCNHLDLSVTIDLYIYGCDIILSVEHILNSVIMQFYISLTIQRSVIIQRFCIVPVTNIQAIFTSFLSGCDHQNDIIGIV